MLTIAGTFHPALSEVEASAKLDGYLPLNFRLASNFNDQVTRLPVRDRDNNQNLGRSQP